MLAEGVRTLGASFDVLEVPSAEEALLISSSLPLDLVVTDVWLPGMSGLDLLTRLRRRSPEMKTILVTGVEEPRLRRQVAEAGATAFFYKPLELADFLDAVERCLGLVGDAFPLPSVAEEPVATAVKLDAGAGKPETPSISLADRLAALGQELGLVSAVLLDASGQVLAQAGDLPEIYSDLALHTALMTTLSASLKVTHALRLESPDDLLCFQGATQYLCLAHLGASNALLIVHEGGYGPESLNAIRKVLPKSLKDLQATLNFLGVDDAAAAHEKQAVAPPEVIPEVVDPAVLAEVDALFQKAQPEKIQQADLFWDQALEGTELDGVSNGDALTYEQARQLGLAPEEE